MSNSCGEVLPKFWTNEKSIGKRTPPARENASSGERLGSREQVLYSLSEPVCTPFSGASLIAKSTYQVMVRKRKAVEPIDFDDQDLRAALQQRHTYIPLVKGTACGIERSCTTSQRSSWHLLVFSSLAQMQCPFIHGVQTGM